MLEVQQANTRIYHVTRSSSEKLTPTTNLLPYSPSPRQGVRTPLFWAARNGHLEEVRLLLESNADTEACSQVRDAD